MLSHNDLLLKVKFIQFEIQEKTRNNLIDSRARKLKSARKNMRDKVIYLTVTRWRTGAGGKKTPPLVLFEK